VKHKAFHMVLVGLLLASMALAACGHEVTSLPTGGPSPTAWPPTDTPSPTGGPSPTAWPPTDTPTPAARPGSRFVFEFRDAREGRAVAFHTLDFIDADANTLGTITFGTPEASALQEEGWLESGSVAGVGSLQWAGGTAQQAAIRVPIPVGAEGLLLKMTSSRGEQWVDVSLDGKAVGSLRVTDEWRTGYVPVGELEPYVVPDRVPQWTEGHYFPVFPPPSGRIFAIHVHSALEEPWGAPDEPGWRINQSLDTMMALTLVGMQGVVNRHGPRIYLDWEEQGSHGHAGAFWIPYIREQADIVELDLDSLSAFQFLYRRFGPYFQGAVVYDPQIPDTINLATTLAGLEDRLILAPEQSGLPGMPENLTVTDLRALAAENGWDNSWEGQTRQYEWMYTSLWPRLEKRAIGIISPGPPTSKIRDQASYYPLGLAVRDLVVALQLPALYLSPGEDPQKALYDRFLNDTTQPVSVLGFYSNQERLTVETISRHGGIASVVTNTNSPLSAGNISVLAGIPAQIKKYNPRLDPERILATLGKQPVVTLWATDGDNLSMNLERGFYGGTQYSWDSARDYRFGWTINPILVDVAPLVWNYYTEADTPAGLVMGVSGAGYTSPGLMDQGQLANYLGYTNAYLQTTGLRVGFYLKSSGGGQAPTAAIGARYYEHLRDVGLLGMFEDFSGWPWGFGFYYPDAPIPAVPPSYVWADNTNGIISHLLSRKAGEFTVDPAVPLQFLLEPGIYNWQAGKPVDDADAKGGKALLFSRRDIPNCCEVLWGPFSHLAPGKYTATFRLKAAESGSDKPFVRLRVETRQAGANRVFAAREIAPNDLTAGQYQDFTLPFTLDRHTTYVETIIDYMAGSGDIPATDLYLDSVRIKRTDDNGMPIFAGIFIIFGEEDLDQRVKTMTGELESAGVVVLRPEEFMAALNPEYMIEFATPILGADHAAIGKARSLLNAGEYYDSLMEVRKALCTHYGLECGP
jgi:hypothetical protein